jgi:Cu(I)/Ag(I) efflux system membrane fusion protein
MDLAPVYEGGPSYDKGDPNLVTLTPASASVIGVATSPVRVAPLERSIRVSGIIDDDETRHRILSARVPGRIEKLFINQVGIEVVSGQELAKIYSPDMLTAQRVYLENLRVGAGAVSASIINTSREKLLALGLTDEDIHQLEKTKTPVDTLSIRAPFNGTVVSRKAYEGQYVNVNDELFEIGDFSELWFVFDAYEADLPYLALNQQVKVNLPSLPGEVITAPITFIDPNLNEATRTARVRVVLPNPQRRILHRQTANGVVQIETAPVLLAPRSAILYTRSEPIAYVDKGGGAYELRALHLGRAGDSDVEILHGLKEGEKVVTQAALLVDSQAQIARVAMGHEATPAGHSHSSQPTPVAKPDAANAVPSMELVHAAIAVTDALSSDDLAAYKKHLPVMLEAFRKSDDTVKARLQSLVDKLVNGPDLKTIRRPFEPFSNALADLVRSQPVEKRHAKIYQCPMTPVLGTARWLQKGEPLKNPFFGAEMLECGEELQ